MDGKNRALAGSVTKAQVKAENKDEDEDLPDVRLWTAEKDKSTRSSGRRSNGTVGAVSSPP
jgi:hypothetical protein